MARESARVDRHRTDDDGEADTPPRCVLDFHPSRKAVLLLLAAATGILQLCLAPVIWQQTSGHPEEGLAARVLAIGSVLLLVGTLVDAVRRRPSAAICPQCRHPVMPVLRAVNACPECGASFDETRPWLTSRARHHRAVVRVCSAMVMILAAVITVATPSLLPESNPEERTFGWNAARVLIDADSVRHMGWGQAMPVDQSAPPLLVIAKAEFVPRLWGTFAVLTVGGAALLLCAWIDRHRASARRLLARHQADLAVRSRPRTLRLAAASLVVAVFAIAMLVLVDRIPPGGGIRGVIEIQPTSTLGAPAWTLR